MANYQAQEIEKKWQEKWNKDKIYKADLADESKPKYYNLVMFPYPSGDKLHIGHWYNFAPADSWGRYMRMKGHNVLQPMGYDSFGLPAENYAIKTGTPPAESITTNTGYMTKQLSEMGAMWDWDKKVITSTPEYYKWTQWIFLQLFNNGLAYKRKAPVNWCPSCQTVLANEQVVEGKCERCKHEVEKKDLNQWFFDIRKYAEKLLNYSDLDWPEKTIAMQKNWIGKSTGANINFKIEDSEETLQVYTTRPDTLFGCTYMVLAPEHPLVPKITTQEQKENIDAYIKKAQKESDIERQSESREKTGVFTGAYAVNPVNNRKVPIWISDYVLVTYGTGAIMAVPAHDTRDYAFAKKYKIEIIPVIQSESAEENIEEEAYTGAGKLINSEEFNGMESKEAIEKITELLKEKGTGEATTQYKLRNWLISRQRYWGAPIPIVYDPEGNAHPVPEEHLPWHLPEDVEFKPTGESPLVNSKEFIERTEKIFGKGWRPEVDTMDTFMCSSWYFLRYLDSKNENEAFGKEVLKKWLPVDMYIGGPEHACMHLLYARFLTHALHDMGHVPVKEPFKRLIHQGMITKDGAKMSKSKGNVVSPDKFIERFGADVFRMYLMFMGPFTDGGDWNDKGITGIKRFVDKFYTLITEPSEVKEQDKLNNLLHSALKRINTEIEKLHFNTMVAACMEFVNGAQKTGIDKESKEKIVKAIAPIAPHLAEELWEVLDNSETIFNEKYPTYDSKYLVKNEIELVVQVNGKVRGKVTIPVDTTQDDAITAALEINNVQKHIGEKEIIKEIYVPGKLVSFVVK